VRGTGPGPWPTGRRAVDPSGLPAACDRTGRPPADDKDSATGQGRWASGGDRLLQAMKVHLVDGTYELFRHFFGAPSHKNAAGQEVAAVRGVLGSVLQLLEEGATHVGVATDHVIESFRN